MTLEQPATLNRFVAERLPVNWSSRWKRIRISLPFLVFVTVCVVEQVAFAMWIHDRFEPAMFLIAFVPSIVLLVILLILTEINLRSQGVERVLSILEEGVSFSNAARAVLSWPKVVAFWLEDVPDAPELRKVTIEYLGGRYGGSPRRYALVLTRRDQCPALLAELNLLQQQYNFKFRVEPDRSPPAILPLRSPVFGMSLMLAGFLVLMHGFPLLLMPLIHHDGPHPSDPNDQWSPKSQETMVKFIEAHFSTREELNHFFYVTGAVLTATGIGLMLAGRKVLQNRDGPGSHRGEVS